MTVCYKKNVRNPETDCDISFHFFIIIVRDVGLPRQKFQDLSFCAIDLFQESVKIMARSILDAPILGINLCIDFVHI